MNVPRQLALALPHAESFARDDFLTGTSNADALATIERWPDWADRVLALTGPEGAGKSHLAAIWAEKAGARRVSARALGETDLLHSLATGALVVEDASAELDERALFHLLNLVREEEGYLLLTARSAPATWGVGLPDLGARHSGKNSHGDSCQRGGHDGAQPRGCQSGSTHASELYV